jgi:hypothetical protein
MSPVKTLRRLVLIGVLACAQVIVAHGSVIYEGFCYPAGSRIHGLGETGEGWGGPWANLRHRLFHYGEIAAPLSGYPTLDTACLAAFGTSWSVLELFRPLDTVLGGRPGDTVWVSLVLADSDTGVSSAFGLINSEYGYDATGRWPMYNQVASVYISGAAANRTARLATHWDNDTWATPEGDRFGAGSAVWTSGPHLVVVRVTMDSVHTEVAAWIDPTGLQTLAAPQLTLTGNNNGPLPIDGVAWYLYQGDRGVNGAMIDEIRIGGSAWEVLPGMHNIRDASRYANHGAGRAMAEADGVIGPAQYFDGESAFIDCGPLLDPAQTGVVTFTAWVKRSETQRSEKVAGMYDRTHGWMGGFDNYGSPRFSTKRDYVTRNLPLHDGAWHHLGFVHTGETLRLLIDGEVVDVDEDAERLDTRGLSLYVGRWLEGQLFHGVLDEVRVSSAARSDDWIRAAYHTGLPRRRCVTMPLVRPSDIVTRVLDNGSVEFSWDAQLLSVDSVQVVCTTYTVGTVPVQRGSMVHEGPSCGNLYYYQARYKAGLAVSPWHALTVATPLCPADWLSSLRVSRTDTTSIELTWACEGNAEGVFVFELRPADSVGAAYEQATLVAGDRRSVTLDGLDPGAPYDIRGRSECQGSVSPWVELLDVRTAYADKRPAAPSGLTATIVGRDTVRLAWLDNADNAEYFVIYRREQGLESASMEPIGLSEAETAVYEDAHTVCGTPYEYRVAALSTTAGGGVSEMSAPALVQLPGCIEDRPNKLVTVAAMLTGQSGEVLADGDVTVEVRYFTSKTSRESVESEDVSAAVVNGYAALTLGRTVALPQLVGAEATLWYEVFAGGVSVSPRTPLTAVASAVTNPRMIHGEDSPIGMVDAPVGTLYLNTAAGRLYFKYGSGLSEWRGVER